MNKEEAKWEYVEHNNLSTEKRLEFLNRMGQLGWELCLVRGGNNYIFKRPLLDNSSILGGERSEHLSTNKENENNG